jgi:TPP-dependent 2-oxoacid decarboxylase
MKNTISGSFFEDLLQKTFQEVPVEKRSELPLGMVMLERDGTLSSIHVPTSEENYDEVVSSMFAMEYILYTFERKDWMAEFVVDMDKLRDRAKEEKVATQRSKFTLIEGGKKD